MARPKTSHPTDRELAILRVLWESGPSTVREVYQTLDKQQKTAYTSVLSVMQTMTGRGLLERDESERGHVYSTTRSQEETQQHSVRDLVDHVFNGSTMSLVLLMLTMLTLSMAALSQPPAHAQESETSLDARELQNVRWRLAC
jgi:predicted transcriptional regulator